MQTSLKKATIIHAGDFESKQRLFDESPSCKGHRNDDSPTNDVLGNVLITITCLTTRSPRTSETAFRVEALCQCISEILEEMRSRE